MIIDKFGKEQPYKSWILNELENAWEAPVAYPDDFKPYTWNENNQEWMLLNNEQN
jgi:hypothetical protein